MDTPLARFLYWIKSLRIRIAVVIFFVAIFPVVSLAIGIPAFYNYRETATVKSTYLNQGQMLASRIASSGYLNQKQDSGSVDGQLQFLASMSGGRVILADSSFRIVKDTNDRAVGKYLVSSDATKCLSTLTPITRVASDGLLEIVVPIQLNATDEVLGILIFSVEMTDMLLVGERLSWALWFAFGATALIAIVLGAIFSGLFTHPMKKMSAEIDDIQSGYNLDALSENTFSETRALAEKFNKLLGQMQTVDQARSEFVSNVSHELKTPLTSMKVLADSLNGQENVPVELYQEFMKDIASEIDRETVIINDLLTLVKMDKTGSVLNISTVNINELVEKTLKRLSPIAEKAGVELVLESFRPAMVEMDEVKFTLAISNLIENGIKYNNPSGWVHVSLNADHQYCYIRVEDNGLGIPADSIEHIFERFYRVDKSHSREIGGSGLGLAITQQAILMHHGEIKAYSVEGEGTTFNVRLPLYYTEKATSEE